MSLVKIQQLIDQQKERSDFLKKMIESFVGRGVNLQIDFKDDFVVVRVKDVSSVIFIIKQNQDVFFKAYFEKFGSKVLFKF